MAKYQYNIIIFMKVLIKVGFGIHSCITTQQEVEKQFHHLIKIKRNLEVTSFVTEGKSH